MQQLLLKVLRTLPPELAHSIGLTGLDLLSKIPLPIFSIPRLSETSAMGIKFPNPVGLAAGFDKNGAHINGLRRLGFGFIEIGTTTPIAQSGNAKPRLFRLSKYNAIINRMGFNNDGIEAVIKNIDFAKKSNTPIGINIGANKHTSEQDRINDYVSCLKSSYGKSDYITINISSPNTKNLRALQKSQDLIKMLEVVNQTKQDLLARSAKDIPIVLKIAPDLDQSEIADITQICLALNISGIIATNTTISREGISGTYANETGGLSGAPLLRKSLNVVRTINKVAEKKIIIIGCGGIQSKADALEFKKEGATLIQIYTGLIYQGPKLINEICECWER